MSSGQNSSHLCLGQVTFAAASAVNTVFYAYVYLCVPPEDYPIATAGIHASYHLGNICGSLLGELLVTSFQTELTTLFYLSMCSTTIGLVCFVVLLPAPTKQHAHLQPSAHGSAEGWSVRWARLKQEVVVLYRDVPAVRTAAAWWVAAYSANLLAGNYYQTMLYNADQDANFGFAEAALELGGVTGSAAYVCWAGYCSSGSGSGSGGGHGDASHARRVEWFLAGALVATAMLHSVASGCGGSGAAGAHTENGSPWLLMAVLVGAAGLYSSALALASVVTAASVGTTAPALIFSINNFGALSFVSSGLVVASTAQLGTAGYFRAAAVLTATASLFLLWLGGRARHDDDAAAAAGRPRD